MLLKEVIDESHDLDTLIFNFSLYELSDNENRKLCEDLNFSVQSKLIEYSESLLPFKLLLQDVKQENLCCEDLSLMKARLLDTTLSLYKSFSSDQSPSENLTISEFKALRHFSKTKILSSRMQIYKVTPL